MKNLQQTIVPMLALLVAGCSSPIAMQSTEYDDMYYTSTDKTEYVEPEAPVSEQAYDQNTINGQEIADGEVLNPEYSENNAAIADDYYGDEYYDGRSYNERDNWYRPSYSFVDPYWATSRARYARSAFYDPFYNPYYSAYSAYYDPFYDPFFPSTYWRSGLNISIGLGMGYGFGSPYGGFGNAWMPGGGFYNGYYNGFYNGYYARNNNWYYDRVGVIGGQPRNVQYGPRGDRSSVPTRRVERAEGRPNRGEQLSVGDEQQMVRPGSTGKEVIRTRPARQSRSTRSGQSAPVIEQQQRSTSPARQSRPQRTRQQSSPVIRQQNTRSYEPARVSPPTPTRSTPVRTGSSSGSSGSRSGGRPTRGGN